MMATQARPNYESSSSKAYDALIDQLENLPSPSQEPEITFNEPAPVQEEMNSDAQPTPPTIAAPVQDNTASETAPQSHGNTFPQGLILPAQEHPQVQSPPPSYNSFNGYAQPREEPKPSYVPPPVQSQPSYALPPQARLPASVNEKYNGYPSLGHSEPSNTSYPSLENSSAEDKIKNILQMYPTNTQPQQKPQPIMPQMQPVAPQPVVSQPQFAQPQQSSPQMQPRPVYHQIQPQPQIQAQPQVNSMYSQPASVVQPKPPVQQQPAIPSPQLARPQSLPPQAAPSPAPQQVQQLAQAQIQSQQINQQTVQVQVQQQQQIQVLQAQQLQQQNMIQQQIQYSKEMCIQMQSYFERIARFMENVDKRLNNLEKVTNDMLKNTSHASGNINPVSSPTDVPIETMFDRSELDRLKKLQTQFDDDAAVARRLQEEYEREARTASSKPSSSSSSKLPSSTPKSTSEKYETCPICQIQIVASKLTQHVNECLDGPGAYSDTKTLTPTPTPTDEKKGFWTSLFGAKKEEPKTETPTPAPVYDLSQNPPQNSKGTYYPAVVPPATPGYPPNGYPMVYPYQFPGNQPMYYYMPGPTQPQPKK